MKHIICKNGEVALCDDDDYHLLSRFTWYMAGELKTGGYPSCNIYGKKGSIRLVAMHQMVMGGKYGYDNVRLVMNFDS